MDYNYEPDLEDFDDYNNMLVDRRPIATVHERLSQLEQGTGDRTADEMKHQDNLALFNSLSISIKQNPFVQLDKNGSSISLPANISTFNINETESTRHRQVSCSDVKISENKFIKTDKHTAADQSHTDDNGVKHVLRRARTMLISTKLLDNFFIRNDPRFNKYSKLPPFNPVKNILSKKNGLLARIASVASLRSSPSVSSLSCIAETQETYATAEFSSALAVDNDNVENSSKSITLMRKMLVEKMVTRVSGAVKTLTRSLSRSHLAEVSMPPGDEVVDA